MKNRFATLLLILSALLVTAPALLAQSGGDVDLSWHVLGSGGTSIVSGGNVTLRGTLGQSATGQSSGGNVDLSGGFWEPSSGGPLAVTLASFTARPDGNRIHLAWETVSEIDHAGFNLYRSETSQGTWSRLNEALIASPTPGSTQGHDYEWTDEAVEAGVNYRYRLHALDIYGVAQTVGEVSAMAGGPAVHPRLWLPLITD